MWAAFPMKVAPFALRGKELFTSNAIMIQKQEKQEISVITVAFCGIVE